MLQNLSHTGLNMKALFLNLDALYPEVDYQTLMAQMQSLSHPRRKLKELQMKGQLIRLKKGFYVLTRDLIAREYSPQIVANLLYGPSYLSLEYALSFYQLIPEKVEAFTSVTTQKNKLFQTPIGTFSYAHLSAQLYPLGVTLQKTADHRSFLMATPEKALMDIFTLRFQNSPTPTSKDVLPALEDDLRISFSVLKTKVKSQNLLALKPFYRRRPWNKLTIDFLLENL